MAIQIIWGDPQYSTIRLKLGCDWTWEEFDAACEQVMEMTESVSHEVEVIMDVHTSITLTPQILKRMHSEHQTIEPTNYTADGQKAMKIGFPNKFATLLKIPS